MRARVVSELFYHFFNIIQSGKADVDFSIYFIVALGFQDSTTYKAQL